MINRDEPELIDIEFDDKPWAIEDFYDEDDNVVIRDFTEQNYKIAFDFDDCFIMAQKVDDKSTQMLNLLYARKHARNLYDMWYEERSKYGRKK